MTPARKRRERRRGGESSSLAALHLNSFQSRGRGLTTVDSRVTHSTTVYLSEKCGRRNHRDGVASTDRMCDKGRRSAHTTSCALPTAGKKSVSWNFVIVGRFRSVNVTVILVFVAVFNYVSHQLCDIELWFAR